MDFVNRAISERWTSDQLNTFLSLFFITFGWVQQQTGQRFIFPYKIHTLLSISNSSMKFIFFVTYQRKVPDLFLYLLQLIPSCKCDTINKQEFINKLKYIPRCRLSHFDIKCLTFGSWSETKCSYPTRKSTIWLE